MTGFKLNDILNICETYVLWEGRKWIITTIKNENVIWIDRIDRHQFYTITEEGWDRSIKQITDCNLPKYIKEKALFYFKIRKILP